MPKNRSIDETPNTVIPVGHSILFTVVTVVIAICGLCIIFAFKKMDEERIMLSNQPQLNIR